MKTFQVGSSKSGHIKLIEDFFFFGNKKKIVGGVDGNPYMPRVTWRDMRTNMLASGDQIDSNPRPKSSWSKA